MKAFTYAPAPFPFLHSIESIPQQRVFIDRGGYLNTEKTKEVTGTFSESEILALENTPPRLGRVSAKLISNNISLIEDGNTLIHQLLNIQEKKPKHKYSFAIINGYGGNLGAVTLGSTAMQYTSEIIQKILPRFSLDLFQPQNSSGYIKSIAVNNKFIGQVINKNPTLEEFSRYDGYFDFSNLIRLPKIMEIPTVDWYIWWLGLDPALVPSEMKRNSLNIEPKEIEFINNLISQHRNNQLVFFNPKASVPLRTCPAKTAIDIIKALLEENTQRIVIVDRKLNFQHARILDLSESITSPGKFTALISLVDGLVTVDSFAPQAADAFSIPTVHITSSLPKEFYPYYPYSTTMEIPGARRLPAWKKFKVPSTEQWERMRKYYEQAWAKLDTELVTHELNRRIKQRLTDFSNYE